jgi:alpha-L-fucosidase
MNGTWGYKSYDHKWKTPETLIHNLIDIASKGGNYLLNVGPTAEGEFPQESITTLKKMREWMKVNSEAIYATKASPLQPLSWGRCTLKPEGKNTILYLSVFNWPADGKLIIPGLKNEIVNAKMLADGTKLITRVTNDETIIDVPAKAQDSIATALTQRIDY